MEDRIETHSFGTRRLAVLVRQPDLPRIRVTLTR